MKLDYDVSIATSGPEAIEIANALRPQLILLDVMMPGMNGYEVCKMLKSNPETNNIPVIFITAKCSSEDETKGFDVGGIDYIKKPFKLSTVTVRVKNHIQLKLYQDKLNELVAEKTGQLIHSDRLATLGTLSSMVAHEIKNPLFFISGNAEMTKHFIENNNSKKAIDKIEKILDGTKRISRIIEALKGYSKPMSDARKEHRLLKIIQDSRTILNYKFLKKNVSLNLSSIDDNQTIFCNLQKMSQVFVNIFVNSIDSFNGDNGTINLAIETTNDRLIIKISDNGTGIPEEKQPKIFEPFISTKTDGNGTGLGLYIVKHIIEEHNGFICLDHSDINGTQFSISVPLPPQQ
jgi:signal transduction histidine kinase